MAIKPVTETDYYGRGFSQQNHNRQMVGPPRMSFGAMRTDEERIQTALESNSFIDSAPTEPEWRVW